MRPSQKKKKKSVNNICDSHPVPPSCSLQRPLSPHCGRRVNCTVRTSGTSKAEVSSVRLCPPPQPSQQAPCPAPQQPQCNMPSPWGPLARYCLRSPSVPRPYLLSPVVKNRIAHPHPGPVFIVESILKTTNLVCLIHQGEGVPDPQPLLSGV